MGHIRRYYPSNKAYFITNRVSEGLPFVANLYINLMLFGILARAHFRSPGVTICGFLFLSNHYHMLVVLNGDPTQLSNFIQYVNGEIAKLVARWLGRRNTKIWAQRYHCAMILTSEAALRQMLYLVLNPVAANLVEKAEHWTGCSSFYAFKDSQPQRYKWFKPSLAKLLPNGPFTKLLLKNLLTYLNKLERPSYLLPIRPFAWMACFADTAGQSEEEMRKRFFEMLSMKEKEATRKRIQAKKGIIGTKLLAQQNPHQAYTPTKFGRRMWCISTCPELRHDFIELYRYLCAQAKIAWHSWVSGFCDELVPHGMFYPPRTPRGSIIFCPI